MSPRLGLMLYTLRDQCASDLEGTLRTVGEIGYAGVELHSLHGRDPAEVRGLLDAHRLEACGRHALLEEIENDLDALAGELRTLGTDKLVLAWISVPASAEDGGRSRRAHRRSRRTRARRGPPARISQPRRRAASTRRRSHRPRQAGRAGRGPTLLRGRPRLGVVRWGRAGRARRASVAARAARPRQGSRAAAEPHFVPVGEGGVGYAAVLPALGGLGVEWLLVEQDEVDGLAVRRRTPVAGRRRGRRGRERRMRAPARVGIVGCGVISHTYAKGAAAFDTFEIVACADLDDARRDAVAAEHGLEPMTVDELLTVASRSTSSSTSRRRAPTSDVTRASARGGQARLLREAARDHVGRRHRPRPPRRVARQAHRVCARHLPRQRVPSGTQAARGGCHRRATRSVAPRCCPEDRSAGTPTPTCSS